MIKLNHKNEHVKIACNKMLESEDCFKDQIKAGSNEVRYFCKGYYIYTNEGGEITQVWQLDNCPNPIFEV